MVKLNYPRSASRSRKFATTLSTIRPRSNITNTVLIENTLDQQLSRWFSKRRRKVSFKPLIFFSLIQPVRKSAFCVRVFQHFTEIMKYRITKKALLIKFLHKYLPELL